TGAFAEDIDGTHAGATEAEDVGVENGLRAAAQIAGGDLLDKARHVDVGGAGGGARSIEAIQAAVGFDHRGWRIEGGVEVRESFEIALNHRTPPAAVAAGSVGEELLFRGYGFQELLAAVGPWATVVPVGILFALLHGANPGATWFS